MEAEGNGIVYFDQSATSIHKPPTVMEAVCRGIQGAFGNPARGSHQASLGALRELGMARRVLARMFNCSPLEVAFCHNATLALNMAIKGALTPSDRVLTTPHSHNSMLRPLYQLSKQGMGLDILPLKPGQPTRISDIRRGLKPDTTALAINPMSNVTGEVLPLRDIISLCNERGLLLILDMAQWAGTRPIPALPEGLRALMAFTGHKSLYGPQGTGGLINKGTVPLRPLISGGTGSQSFSKEHPESFPAVCEAGTPNLPGIMGLSAAVTWLIETGLEQVNEKLTSLRSQLKAGLAQIPGIICYDAPGGEHGPVLALNIRDLPSGSVSDALDREFGIATRSGAHCAPLMHESLGTVAQGAVRFSFSVFNTPGEINKALDALKKLASSA